MGVFQLCRRKFLRTLVIWVLFSSVIVIPSLTLVKPARSDTQWWNTDWSFRKQITINHAMVAADLTDFPVLIVDSNLTGAQPLGGDIVFINDQNVKLAHEIEYYDSNLGLFIAWVRIPLLSSATDTILYMYYGNSGASDQQNRTGVWNANFAMVQHLEETSTKRYDSTVNRNNGTISSKGVSKSVSGKIDGADSFNGSNGYITIPNSQSLNPSSAISIELWMNLSSTTDYINLVNKNTYNQYYLRLDGRSEGSTYWSVKFTDGNAGIVSGNIGWKFNKWHHVVATLDTQARTINVYLDGVQKLSGTFASGKSIASTTSSVLISGTTSRWIKGSIDEARISNSARSAAWVKTSYNNQLNPALFSVVGNKEIGPNPTLGPAVFENPLNGSVNVYTNPTLSALVSDPNGGRMTVIFRENVSNIWINLRVYQNVQDGVYYANATQMRKLGTTYYWGVSASNGESWTNRTYRLTTTSTILSQKWTVSTSMRGVAGALAADTNGDGKDEVIYAGIGGVTVLNGSDGRTLWSFSDSAIGFEAQAQMADLNHDGILEIIVPLESPAGLLVLHSNNGSVYWRRTDLGKETFSSPAIFDIDGNGYPTIFVGSTDVSHGLQGTGRLTSLSYDGKILHQIFAWRPCSGGVSIADTDNDGQYELYMGDRYAYFEQSPWSDNDYGKGAQSYWASNLTLRWSRPDIFMSSQVPMIADANNDGKLEVIVGDLTGAWWVLNATDGSTIKSRRSMWVPTHYQPSLYDIDGDGRLEMLMADGSDEAKTNNTVVWDLLSNSMDANMSLGKSHYGPKVGDVNGDGLMEIISATENGIFIINGTYTILTRVTGFTSTLNYGVLQDIDGDGYNELIMTTSSGTIYAYDTPARRPNPRPRTETLFYSEYRRGAAEYVKPQGGPAPVVVFPNPQNLAESMPLSLSKLEFTLTDYQNDLMNYTVTTYPNIGNGTGTNKSNGKYNVPISNLAPSTTYTWNIIATDGTHLTNITYSFTTRSISPWLRGDWQYRKTITIHHEKVSGDLSNFPVLIDITDSDLSKAQPDGGDIIFTDASNNKLSHEIELYNSANGHLIAWVSLPQLSSTTDTILNMYYGNPTIGDQQKPTLTWNSGYIMVQHLEETSQTKRYDSTINHNNGTVIGGVGKSSFGKIDGADLFDGVNDYLSVPSSGSLNPTSALTVELWMNLSSTGTYINLINKGTWNQYSLRLGPSEGRIYWYVKFSDSTTAFVEGYNTGWKFNTWHHIVATVDTQARTMKVYLDGVEKLSGSFGPGKSIFSASNPISISGPTERWIKGSIDEVRISSVGRSPAWIQAGYNNQKDPATFYVEGEEETIPVGPVIFGLTPANKARGILTSLSTLSFNLTDAQSDFMNYTVTTYPNIGSGEGVDVTQGRFVVNVANLQYSTTYLWSINVTDGLRWTNRTLSFTTTPSTPPTQDNPTLTLSSGNLIGRNQTTADPDRNKVTNVYNWYRNGSSLTNLLLPFDTNSSTMTKDYSGYGNNGIIIRGATWTPNGKIGGAYTFDKGYILIPGSDTLDGGGQWSEITVEHWIYLTATQSGDRRTIARIPSYEIGVTSSNHVFASIWVDPNNSSISGYNHVESSSSLSLNTWYHVVLTYKSGVGIKLYVNGYLRAQSGPFSGNIQGSGFNPLYIGWFDYFKGKIDEVRIYSRSLSSSQVVQRYNETKDGLTSSSTILGIETQVGEVWQCAVTPNDSYIDGTTKYSNSVTT